MSFRALQVDTQRTLDSLRRKPLWLSRWHRVDGPGWVRWCRSELTSGGSLRIVNGPLIPPAAGRRPEEDNRG